MLTKEQKKEANELFWGGFKTYSKAYKSCNGRRMNWANYPTDVKDLYVRLHADAAMAMLTFDIQPKDSGIRAILWEQMNELKKVMEENMTIKPLWVEHLNMPDGRVISRIQWKKENVNFLNPADHKVMFEFFMAVLLPFDEFYQEFKDILINLTD
jgi:hypothetical protein